MTLSARAIALDGLLSPISAPLVALLGFIGVTSVVERSPFVIPYVPTIPVTVRVPVAALSPIATSGRRVLVAPLAAISVLGPSVSVAPRRSIATSTASIATVPPWAALVPTVAPGDEA